MMKVTSYVRYIVGLIAFVSMLASCNSTYTSKKKGYYRIDFPEKAYQPFNDMAYPFSFEYPVYGRVIRDSTFFENNPDDKYWVNVDFPQFNARVFLSYKIIGGNSLYKLKGADGIYRDSIGRNDFEKLVTDAYNLTGKNEIIASSIRDSVFTTTSGVSGVYFKVGGNVATGRQFFMTDTVKNYIRGALYFNATPNADSLRPVQEFLQKDIAHLINTFRWK